MIKFFRRFRRQFLAENKFSKYLIYAIGEIVLVVIGILIALQINNWNENNKLEAKKQDYYQQLLEDLNKDKIFVNTTIAKFQAQRKAYKDYLKKFNKSQLTIRTMYNELLNLNTESFGINFNTSTIESLQNSGEIVLIPPFLRNKLVDLKRQQEKIASDENKDNRSKNGVAERVSMIIGSFSLEERLENQNEIKTSLNIEKNINEIIVGFEAMQDWMNFSETKSIRLLTALITEIDAIEVLIRKEVK